MNKREQQFHMTKALATLGLTYDDIETLRRASRTLQRWFELKCGGLDIYGSWCFVRGAKRKVPLDKSMPLQEAQKRPAYEFCHDDDGAPFMERQSYHEAGKTTYTPIPDREKGARKRIAKILAKHPGLESYIQGDPRGCALYILRPGDVPAGEDVSSYYTRGIAVY